MAESTININRVYPPIVGSSIPAFLASDATLNIEFSLPKSLNYDDVKNISIKFTQQSNNKSVVNTDIYYDGIIYMEKPAYSSTGIYKITVNSSDIKLGDNYGWTANTFYKIQLRFGYNNLNYTDKVSFFKWKKAQNTATAFSEWSNVIITKAIQEPIVDILNNRDTTSLDVGFILISSQNVESSRFPKFQGGYYNVAEEPLDKYRFRLYEGSYTSELLPTSDPYLQTDWIQFNGSGNNKYSGLVEYSFNQQLDYTGLKTYSIIFDVITANGYQKSSEFYNFTITENYLKQFKSLVFVVKDNTERTTYKDLFYVADENNFNNYLSYFELEGVNPTYDANTTNKATGDIGYIINGTEHKILTRAMREQAVQDFNNKLRVDENASLEIYIKNTPYWQEVEKIAYDENGNQITYYAREKQYESLDGTFILSRACGKDNYTQWEDIAEFNWYNETTYDSRLTLLYEDFTIESGVKYKYALQKINVAGIRSAPKYEFDTLEQSPEHWSNFQYSYIYNNGIQVRLNYDCKINSYKHTTLFQKQDSLNSKYPIILRNGLAHYAEFQLGAKISLLSDEDLSFFLRNDLYGGYFHNGELIISTDKYLTQFKRQLEIANNNYQNMSKTTSSLNNQPTNNNIYMERIYRHWVEEFLNDGGYKLFKSATEGNHIITLTNVTWTPQATLGRMIYDFNSTAYEVADCTPTNIKLYNINPLDSLSNNSKLAIQNANAKEKTIVGQIAKVFTGIYDKKNSKDLRNIEIFNNPLFNSTYDNIYNSIRLQEEKEISEDKKYILRKIKSIWIEAYPKLQLKNKIIALEAKTTGTRIEMLENALEILKYKQLLLEYEKNQSNIITMIINDREISMFPGRIYHLDDIDLKSMYLKFTRPVLINYIADLEEEDYLEKVTIAKRELAQMGQLHGIFTETQDILDNHQFFRNDNNYIVSEKYNYGLYSTLDIMKIIKEKNHSFILSAYTDTKIPSSFEKLNNTIDEYLQKIKVIDEDYDPSQLIIEGTMLLEEYRPLSSIQENSQTDVWENSSSQLVVYNFDGIENIEIEADEGTDLMMYRQTTYDPSTDSYQVDKIGTRIRIGPTNKYVLKPLENEVTDLYFLLPSYAIINYKAISSIEVKGFQT